MSCLININIKTIELTSHTLRYWVLFTLLHPKFFNLSGFCINKYCSPVSNYQGL